MLWHKIIILLWDSCYGRKKSHWPITTKSKDKIFINIKSYYFKRLGKNYNKILVKTMDLYNQKMTNHPPSTVLIFMALFQLIDGVAVNLSFNLYI